MLNSPKFVLERFAGAVKLLPGLSEGEIAQCQSQIPGPLPDQVRELLQYTAGFKTEAFGTLRFTGTQGFELPEAFPRSVPLLPDGYGNFWVVDIDPQDGAWGAIFYACHDPAVIAVQAENLVTFLSQLLDPSTSSEPKNAVHYVHDEAVRLIWKEDPWLISVQDARRAKDDVVAKFARELPDNFRVADLRSTKVGSGFSWGKAGADAEIRRVGNELIFGVQSEVPTFLKRLFSRR